MAAAAATKNIIDGDNVTFAQRVLDESGTGAGPFVPASIQARPDGSLIKSEWQAVAPSGGIVNSVTPAALVAAPGATLRHYLQSLDVAAINIGTATELVVQEVGGGAVLWRTKIGTAGLPLSGVRFSPPIKAGVNVGLEVATLTAAGAGSSVHVNARGFVAA